MRQLAAQRHRERLTEATRPHGKSTAARFLTWLRERRAIMTEKYYRNVITVEFLSNDPWGKEAENLQTVHYEITEGGSIGYTTRTLANEELTREEAVAADLRLGGDGSFLISELPENEES
jgi:hypothetical protein